VERASRVFPWNYPGNVHGNLVVAREISQGKCTPLELEIYAKAKVQMIICACYPARGDVEYTQDHQFGQTMSYLFCSQIRQLDTIRWRPGD
jgi:hypothetical protein